MSVSTIDGTLESVSVKRKASKMWQLADLVFRKADGTQEVVEGRSVVAAEIGAALQPGVSGRFYLYKALDHKGIHAVRSADGAVLMKFPATNENLMALLFVINIVVVAGITALNGQPYLLNVLLVPFTGILYFIYRGTRVQAEAQVAADGGVQRP